MITPTQQEIEEAIVLIKIIASKLERGEEQIGRGAIPSYSLEDLVEDLCSNRITRDLLITVDEERLELLSRDEQHWRLFISMYYRDPEGSKLKAQIDAVEKVRRELS